MEPLSDSYKHSVTDLVRRHGHLFESALFEDRFPIEHELGGHGGYSAWVSLDVQALIHNIRRIRGHIKQFFPSRYAMCYMVKANAYGHGAWIPILARLHDLEKRRATFFAVAKMSEACRLRHLLTACGLKASILAQLALTLNDVSLSVRYDIWSVVVEKDVLLALDEEAGRQGRHAQVFFKLNSGMNRQGSDPEQLLDLYTLAHSLPNISVMGIMTHLAVADRPEQPEALAFTHQQFRCFLDLLHDIHARSNRGELIFPPYISVCNTPALVNIESLLSGTTIQSELNALLEDNPYSKLLFRPGISMYGLSHGQDDQDRPFGVKPVMSVYGRVSHVQALPQGEGVSYGAHFDYAAPRDTTRAVVKIGYGDGIFRAPRHEDGSEVTLVAEINGEEVPIIGKICMDQCTLDVGDLQVQPGDPVRFIGGDGSVSGEKIANRYGTVSYEIVTRIASHLPRILFL